MFPAISQGLGLTNNRLQDRLRGYAKSFDGLMSLIPAKDYYGGDTTVCDSRILSYMAGMLMRQFRINGSARNRQKNKLQLQNEQN